MCFSCFILYLDFFFFLGIIRVLWIFLNRKILIIEFHFFSPNFTFLSSQVASLFTLSSWMVAENTIETLWRGDVVRDAWEREEGVRSIPSSCIKKRNFLFLFYFSPTLSTLQVLSSSAISSRKKGPRLGCGTKRSLNYGFLSQMHIFYFILLKFQTIFFPFTPLHTSSRQDKTLPS